MHIIQDKNDVILIMYNLSNAITCLKCTTKFIVFSVYIGIYIPIKPKHV
jgi:hypothetical protein